MRNVPLTTKVILKHVSAVGTFRRPDDRNAELTGEVMGHTRRVAAAMSAGLLLLTACAHDDGNDDPAPIGGENEADPGDADTTDEDAEEEDEPYAVPDEIDEDYAEDVINALLEIDHEILVTALQQEQGEPLDLEATDRLHAIADGDRRKSSLRRLQGYIDDPETAQGLLPPNESKPSQMEVDSVIHAESEHCMLVAGWWDRNGMATDPPPEERKTVFSLSRVDREATSVERNPTPWMIRHIAPLQADDGEPIPDEEWGEIDFADALDRTCEER